MAPRHRLDRCLQLRFRHSPVGSATLCPRCLGTVLLGGAEARSRDTARDPRARAPLGGGRRAGRAPLPEFADRGCTRARDGCARLAPGLRGRACSHPARVCLATRPLPPTRSPPSPRRVRLTAPPPKSFVGGVGASYRASRPDLRARTGDAERPREKKEREREVVFVRFCLSHVGAMSDVQLRKGQILVQRTPMKKTSTYHKVRCYLGQNNYLQIACNYRLMTLLLIPTYNHTYK